MFFLAKGDTASGVQNEEQIQHVPRQKNRGERLKSLSRGQNDCQARKKLKREKMKWKIKH